VITVNRRPLQEYFVNEKDRYWLLEPVDAVHKRSDIDILITVSGGGATGQAGACRMGIARALMSFDMELFPPLRDGGFLTRDSRMKERKKYGLHGARRGTQFSKR
jgi:small subunit ribosomal protein S9